MALDALRDEFFPGTQLLEHDHEVGLQALREAGVVEYGAEGVAHRPVVAEQQHRPQHQPVFPDFGLDPLVH